MQSQVFAATVHSIRVLDTGNTERLGKRHLQRKLALIDPIITQLKGEDG